VIISSNKPKQWAGSTLFLLLKCCCQVAATCTWSNYPAQGLELLTQRFFVNQYFIQVFYCSYLCIPPSKSRTINVIYLVCVFRHEWYLIKPDNSFLVSCYLKPWGSIGSFSNQLLLHFYPVWFAGNSAAVQSFQILWETKYFLLSWYREKDTNVTVAEARFCNPLELFSETVKSVVSGDLTNITRL
jgi:hypothetical protein